jgi:Na+/alanine symporter
MWGIFEVFADTMVVCTMTALVVLTSGIFNAKTGAIAEGLTDATLVAGADAGETTNVGIGLDISGAKKYLKVTGATTAVAILGDAKIDPSA